MVLRKCYYCSDLSYLSPFFLTRVYLIADMRVVVEMEGWVEKEGERKIVQLFRMKYIFLLK